VLSFVSNTNNCFESENREKVCRFVRVGRITSVPWYTLPDLNPVDGECLVRNLLKGIRVSRELAACLDIWYSSSVGVRLLCSSSL